MKKRSVWPWLGTYVVPKNLRVAGDYPGTWRIRFEVPKRLRPEGWPPVIELPRDEPYCTGPDDLECIIRIRQEARALYESLKAGRNVHEEAPPPVRIGSIPWLIIKWGGQGLMDAVIGKIGTTEAALNPDPTSREEWLNCEPRTRKLYIRSLRHVMGWSTSIRHLPVNNIKPAQLRDYLNRFTPGQRKNIRDALSSLFGIAGEESMLETNPLNGKKAGLKRQVKKKNKAKKKIECWPRDDVGFYANIARTTTAWMNFVGKRTKRTWPGGSIMVQLMYETAADSTDVMTWTKAKHLVEREGYRGVDFDRGKTGQPTFIPLSADLLAEIDANGSEHLVTDPFGLPYTAVVDDTRMRGHMITLQEQVVKAGGVKRIYDHLRHSAATEAEEMGMELEKVRHLTAHKDPSMLREVYVQQSAKITVEIQMKRGLIGTDERRKKNGKARSLPGESAG